MQKTILGDLNGESKHPGDQCFGIETIAGIGVTSEAEGAPVGSIFNSCDYTEWRAGTPGLQVIRMYALEQPQG
jgi:hypothetical protein